MMWEFENDEYFHLGRKEGQKAVLASLTAGSFAHQPNSWILQSNASFGNLPSDGTVMTLCRSVALP
jgi:hypothetical protein